MVENAEHLSEIAVEPPRICPTLVNPPTDCRETVIDPQTLSLDRFEARRLAGIRATDGQPRAVSTSRLNNRRQVLMVQ
jgi:hypothetical protein